MKFKIDIKDKYTKSKDSIREASASASDMKDITGDLITKSRNLLHSLISQNSNKDNIFHNFKISKNKSLMAAAAYFLGDSYKFSRENHNNNFISKKNFKNERVFAKYANGIYSNKQIKTLKPLVKNGKDMIYVEQHKKGVLLPVHGVFKNVETKSIILAIRGTASPQDAIIDGLATTATIKLQSKNYSVHDGFLRAATFIANERERELKEILNSNPGYTLTVTGHSLGGATATVTGVILFEKHFNREIPINICGFASGTSFTAQENGKPLEQYLKKYPKLKIKTFIYENDLVPRLSSFEIFVFLATCVSIVKLIFLGNSIDYIPELREINRHFSNEDRALFLKHNMKTRGLISSSKKIKDASQFIGNKKKQISKFLTRKRQKGGLDKSTMYVNKLCNSIYKIIYTHFEKIFKKSGEFYKLFTSIPGDVYHLSDSNINKINPYNLKARFKKDSLRNHLMNNYIAALGQTGGRKTRRRKRTKRRRRTRRRWSY